MELRDYLSMLNRRRGAIAIVTTAVTAAALAATILTSGGTTAQAVATTPALRADGIIVPMAPDVMIERELEIARSAQVVDRASARTGVSPATLRETVNVAPAAATSRGTIVFAATHEDPSTAASIANTMAEEYVEASNAALLADLERFRTAVRDGIVELSEDTVAFLERMAESGIDVSELSVGRGATGIDARLVDIAALIEMESSRAALVGPASEGVVDTSPLRSAVLGLTLGLLLGIATAFVQEQVDTRIRSAGQLRSLLPGVTIIDTAGPRGRSRDEAVRLLAGLLGKSDSRALSVAVLSPTADGSDRGVAVALGEALSRDAGRVIVASWRSSDPAPVQILARHGIEPDLDLPSTHRPADSVALLLDNADSVVFDMPPALGSIDIAEFPGRPDAVVLAVEAGSSTVPDVDETAALLAEFDLPIKSAILLPADAQRR